MIHYQSLSTFQIFPLRDQDLYLHKIWIQSALNESVSFRESKGN